MKNIFKKLLGRLSSKTQDEEQRVRKLKHNKESDSARWKKNEQLFQDWNERTERMFSYINNKASIIEFGAGIMYLKELLKPDQEYTPSDIVQRFPETMVCDLNKPIPFSIESYDTALFSGVLEYVYDVDTVFYQLNQAKIKNVIVSYCCNDIITLSREKNGWLSDFSRAEMESIFENHNYKVLDYQEWRNQSIFNLKKQS